MTPHRDIDILAANYQLLEQDLVNAGGNFGLASRLLRAGSWAQAETAIRRGLEGLERAVNCVPRSEPVEV